MDQGGAVFVTNPERILVYCGEFSFGLFKIVIRSFKADLQSLASIKWRHFYCLKIGLNGSTMNIFKFLSNDRTTLAHVLGEKHIATCGIII